MSIERIPPASRRRFLALVWAVLALAVGFPAASNAQTPERLYPVRLWVEVRDAGGRIPQDLAPGDLEILEGGVPMQIATVDPAGPERRAQSGEPSRFVVWFDLASAGKGTVRRAVEGLLPVARRLGELGDVDLVMADEVPEVALSTRDELVLSERLRWSATNNPGQGEVLAVRAVTLADVQRLRRLPGSTPEEVAARVISGVEEEIELIRERHDMLVAWIGAQPRTGPRVLFLVTDGFDVDPLTFYGEHLDEGTWRAALRSTRAGVELETSIREAAQAIAALGWTVIPVAMETAPESSKLRPTLIEGTDQQGITTGGAGITVSPGSIFRRNRDKEAETAPAALEARFVDPAAALGILADASGGEVVRSERGLEDAVQRFARRFEISYATTRPVDDGLLTLDVRSQQAGYNVQAGRWWSHNVPDTVAALRVRRLLRGDPPSGDLDVAAVLRISDAAAPEGAQVPADLEARLQLRDLYGDDDRPSSASFRVTVGVALPGEAPRVEREVVTGQNLDGQTEWQYRRSLEVPPDASQVAILVEELDLERWGGTRAGVVATGVGVEDVAPAPQVIAIQRPEEELLRGRVRFAAGAFDNRVDRVIFRLDERDVVEVTRRPFEARIDLGRSPRRQTLTVVAFDASDQELGRDSVILNAGSGGLEVRIIRPDTLEGTGLIDVEASVAVPVERRLDRVLFFWNSDPIATLYAPPFRQRLYIPPERPVGYVRVVAMLDDGTIAEDVVFMNGPRSSDRVDVSLVELYVVVTNERGRPVRGLTQADFRVREEGTQQEIASFSDASDLPLTLGMAIDSSTSMFVKLPSVQRAAIRFLRSTFSEQDRAFVVDFDSQPRLVRSTTAQLESVERSIESLEASGRTALWESVVYSLVQLQGVRGRKALIVFSDGADEDDQFPFGSCLSFAKKMGVPIYLILMKREPQPRAGLSLFARSFTSRVDRLVETTGGRVFYAKEYRDLDEVYEEIETELRSQYLLTYYPSGNGGRSAWRDVDVDVLDKGLTPRTLSGYWQ